jgi:large subunit ribosomal protein L5
MAEKVAATYTPRLKKLYSDQIAGELKKELELSNIHQVPSLKKIVVASGVGRNKDNKHFQEVVANTLTRITGQKPVSRIAKKSIATNVKHAKTVTVSSTLYLYSLLSTTSTPRIYSITGLSKK